MKIGVFDSGVGGRSVANAIESALLGVEVIFLSDPENLPYGIKTPEELKKLVKPKMEKLLDNGVGIVVIACNTLSTTILDYIKSIVRVPVIGVEPMIEEASTLTKNKVIAVCATPTTLSSVRYGYLKNKYAKDIKILEPDCSRWTKMIETNNIDRQEIQEKINFVCSAGADVIVLGCTHYHWIQDLITETSNNRAKVINPEAKIVEALKSLLNS